MKLLTSLWTFRFISFKQFMFHGLIETRVEIKKRYLTRFKLDTDPVIVVKLSN